MNSKVFFILLLLVGGMAVFGLTTKQKGEVTVNANKAQAQVGTDKTAVFESQSKAMGAVDIEVTPLQLQSGKETNFKIALNTHSVSLDYDFTKILSLTDDSGQMYGVKEWNGGQGGHHLSGDIIFEILSDDAKTVTLKIQGIDNQTSEFVWNL